MKYTEELGFSIPIHERVESRCVHRRYNGHFSGTSQSSLGEIYDDDINYEDLDENTGERTNGNQEDTAVDPFLSLMRALDSLELDDDQLQAFRLAYVSYLGQLLTSI